MKFLKGSIKACKLQNCHIQIDVPHSCRCYRHHRIVQGTASWSSGDSEWFNAYDDDEPFGAGLLQVAVSTMKIQSS